MNTNNVIELNARRFDAAVETGSTARARTARPAIYDEDRFMTPRKAQIHRLTVDELRDSGHRASSLYVPARQEESDRRSAAVEKPKHTAVAQTVAAVLESLCAVTLIACLLIGVTIFAAIAL